MKEIAFQDIVQTVKRLCIEANYFLGEDVVQALQKAREQEISPLGREILDQLLENAAIARQEEAPICQDTGLTVVFAEVGQDVHIVGGAFEDAINEGVRQGYTEGYLRKSMVYPPFGSRKNTRDNTPAVIHVRLVPGNQLKLTVLPKGGGSENMSFLSMMAPAAGRQGIVDFVVASVEKAGANPCPPIIVGVGIGGSADKAMELAKHALLRPVGQHHPEPEVADLERELLERINRTGIGPQGLGGSTTALAVHIETYPCHLASMPVAVNIQCHAARHKEAIL
ncbi:MAG: fumarate hydratase [Anaerolineae bacterium]|nr:fumarate hydratase [Anaerolineae bacterium]